jgi:hypothetical protein
MGNRSDGHEILSPAFKLSRPRHGFLRCGENVVRRNQNLFRREPAGKRMGAHESIRDIKPQTPNPRIQRPYQVLVRAIRGSTGYSDWSDTASHMSM